RRRVDNAVKIAVNLHHLLDSCTEVRAIIVRRIDFREIHILAELDANLIDPNERGGRNSTDSGERSRVTGEPSEVNELRNRVLVYRNRLGREERQNTDMIRYCDEIVVVDYITAADTDMVCPYLKSSVR